MKNFNFRSKKLIGSLLTVILIGFGVANPGVVGPVLTEVTCTVVACDA